ncbi:MAG: zinc-binding dehydrogenase [Chloroflexaceae bacterium]|nr:zinc-binding dehydrogenase [Chloroflexaceae bacterium]
MTRWKNYAVAHTAVELGQTFTINAKYVDPVEEIKKHGAADGVISTAVSAKAFEQGYRALRRGGKIVFVALPADNFVQLPIFETVLNGVSVIGSIVGTRLDLQETFELHAAGKTRVIYEKRNLEQANEAFAEVERGTLLTPRLVFDLS